MNRIFTAILIATAIIVALILLALIAGTVLELVTADSSKALDTGEVLFAVKLSLITATIASIAALCVSIPLAYLLSRYNFFGKTLLDTLLDLPIVLSPIAVGAMLLIFFNTPAGKLINNHLGPFVFEVKGIILAQFIIVLGLSVRLLKTAFDGVDTECFIARKDGQVVGIALPTAGIGYAGAVNFLVGVDMRGEITGMALLSHQETPGLGAKAGDASFLAQFIGKTLGVGEAFSVTQDGGSIEAITAATITSRAVAEAASKAVNTLLEQQKDLV